MPWAWEKGPEPIALPRTVQTNSSGLSFDEFIAQSVETPNSSADLLKTEASDDPLSSKNTQETCSSHSEALSVSEAVLLAKEQINQLPELVITGEITGFRGPNARSGHCYFQLKDENAAMDVTMWRFAYQKLGFEFKDGLMVQMTGAFQVYDKRGSLSFIASKATIAGEGLLRQQVAELARKLEREGLMDAERKRPIPRFCERICVVTSLSGAVIDDVRRTLARRNPLVELQEVGCMVQGEGAPASIMRALAVATAARPDAILLVRGGGSFEDLMTFNDEALARAVAACPVPVICGIGHEPDTSICDMVCDRRCSTPTAAAESVAPGIDELANVMDERRGRLARAMFSVLNNQRQILSTYAATAERAIRYSVSQQVQKIDALASHRCLQDPTAPLDDHRMSLELTSERLHNAMPRKLEADSQRLGATATRLFTVGGQILQPYEQDVMRAAATLDALSPLRVLARGYSVVRDAQSHVVMSSDKLSVGSCVSLLFAEGGAKAQITEIRR